MKRILVFSDSHDRLALCEKAIKNVPCDLILHAGDYARDAQELKKRFPDRELVYVRGNCDIHAYAQDDEIIVLDHGNVVERGTHEELYSKNGVYTRLVTSE